MKTKSDPNVTKFFNCLYSDTDLFGKRRTKPVSRADALKSVAIYLKSTVMHGSPGIATSS